MRRRRIYEVLTGCLLLSFAFCGCTGKETSGEGETKNTDVRTEAYRETEVFLPEDTGVLLALNELGDGTLLGIESGGSVLTSGDGGSTWEQRELSVTAGDGKEPEMACISENGEIFLELGVLDGQEGHGHPHEYYRIGLEGEETQVEVSLPGEGGALIRGVSLEEGSVAAWYQGDGSVYQITLEDGRCGKLFQAEQGYRGLAAADQKILADDGEKLLVYDRESKATEALETGSTDGRIFAGGKGGAFYELNSGGICLLDEKGQKNVIVEGNTNAIGNPNLSCLFFQALDNGDFLAVFQGKDQACRVMKYTKDPREPEQEMSEGKGEETEKEEETEPEKQGLKIYSMYDSEMIRLAIDAYQSKNPGVEVSFEVGVTETDAVTVADAVKTLNTELMAGSGPDVMFLDELPLEDYIDKGILEDVSPILEEYGENQLYEKIVKTYEKDGKICAVPARFTLPFLVWSGEEIQDAGDLSQVADAVEKYGTQENSQKVVAPVTPGQIIDSFYEAYMPQIYGWNQELKEEDLAEFFRQMARICAVRKERTTDEEYARGEAFEKDSFEGIFSSGSYSFGQLLAGKIQLAISHVESVEGYGSILSLTRKDSSIRSQGLGKVYTPMRIVGIRSKSDQKEEGRNFLRLLLSKEVQENCSFRETPGFPVNKEALEEFGRMNGEENGARVNERLLPTDFVMSSENPEDFEFESLEIYWPEDSDYENLRAIFEELEVPFQRNSELRQAVMEQGRKCLTGELTPEAAAEAVMQEIRLQMLE